MYVCMNGWIDVCLASTWTVGWILKRSIFWDILYSPVNVKQQARNHIQQATSCWVLACTTLWSWRWRWHDSLKHQWTFTTQSYISEVWTVHNHHCVNLKSYIIGWILFMFVIQEFINPRPVSGKSECSSFRNRYPSDGPQNTKWLWWFWLNFSNIWRLYLNKTAEVVS
jgi:hypothetical protein